MTTSYTYLIAGLPEMSFGAEVKNFDFQRVAVDIAERLDEHDVSCLRLLLLGLETPVPYFYRVAAKSKNRFMREYFLFDTMLRNMQAGLAARKTGKSAEPYLVGESVVAEAIRQSKAPDFGLSMEMGHVQKIIAVFDTADVLDREQKIDLLRWEKVNEIALFNYFDMDAVLAFVVKAFLVNRWMLLDKDRGTGMFKQLLQDCRGELEYVKMPSK